MVNKFPGGQERGFLGPSIIGRQESQTEKCIEIFFPHVYHADMVIAQLIYGRLLVGLDRLDEQRYESWLSRRF